MAEVLQGRARVTRATLSIMTARLLNAGAKDVNPESIPKLRVIDSGASRAATPAAEQVASADALTQTAATTRRKLWPLGLLFLAGALIGGALFPLLQRLV